MRLFQYVDNFVDKKISKILRTYHNYINTYILYCQTYGEMWITIFSFLFF